jgi:hypothetical protein
VLGVPPEAVAPPVAVVPPTEDADVLGVPPEAVAPPVADVPPTEDADVLGVPPLESVPPVEVFVPVDVVAVRAELPPRSSWDEVLSPAVPPVAFRPTEKGSDRMHPLARYSVKSETSV